MSNFFHRLILTIGITFLNGGHYDSMGEIYLGILLTKGMRNL